MANWVECTPQGDETRRVYVNLDVAVWIVPQGQGARIVCPGAPESFIDVVEPPREVLSKRSF